MSEWQPAIFVLAHFSAEIATELGETLAEHGPHKKIEVRPVQALPHIIRTFRSVGCDAANFYEVREVYQQDTVGDKTGNIVCEHQILTD